MVSTSTQPLSRRHFAHTGISQADRIFAIWKIWPDLEIVPVKGHQYLTGFIEGINTK